MPGFRVAVTVLLLLPAAASAKRAVATFCPGGKTQHELNVCAADEQDKAEVALARALKAANARLADDEQRARLAVAQTAWSQYRTAECDARHWPSRHGTIYPMVRALCLAEMARTRIADLEGLPLPPD